MCETMTHGSLDRPAAGAGPVVVQKRQTVHTGMAGVVTPGGAPHGLGVREGRNGVTQRASGARIRVVERAGGLAGSARGVALW
jgi:hypothetical protein